MQDVDGQALLSNTIMHIPDLDGLSTEIECTDYCANLEHEFLGENLRDKNTRKCVTLLSMGFIPKAGELRERIYE